MLDLKELLKIYYLLNFLQKDFFDRYLQLNVSAAVLSQVHAWQDLKSCAACYFQEVSRLSTQIFAKGFVM